MNLTATNSNQGGNPDAGRLWNACYITLFLVNLLVSMTLYMTNTLMAGFLAQKNIAVVSVGNILGTMSIASMCIRLHGGNVGVRLFIVHPCVLYSPYPPGNFLRHCNYGYNGLCV